MSALEKVIREYDVCDEESAVIQACAYSELSDLRAEVERLKAENEKANKILNMVLDEFHRTLKYPPTYDILILEDWIQRNQPPEEVKTLVGNFKPAGKGKTIFYFDAEEK